MALLVTGSPGVGKTTLLSKITSMIQTSHPAISTCGFITTELRGAGGRIGFDVVTLDRRTTAPLARVDSGNAPPRAPRVGKYVVDINSFESVALPILDRIQRDIRTPNAAQSTVYILDEIGKMELFSNRFVALMKDILASAHSVPVLCTIALNGPGLIQEAKRIPGVQLHTVTHENRNDLSAIIVDALLSRLPNRNVPMGRPRAGVQTSSSANDPRGRGYQGLLSALFYCQGSGPLQRQSPWGVPSMQPPAPQPSAPSSSLSRGGPAPTTSAKRKWQQVTENSVASGSPPSNSNNTFSSSSSSSPAASLELVPSAVFTGGKNHKVFNRPKKN